MGLQAMQSQRSQSLHMGSCHADICKWPILDGSAWQAQLLSLQCYSIQVCICCCIMPSSCRKGTPEF